MQMHAETSLKMKFFFLLCGSWKQEGKWIENASKDGWNGNQETPVTILLHFLSFPHIVRKDKKSALFALNIKETE